MSPATLCSSSGGQLH